MMRITFITDKYPPNSLGGAETSLKLVIDSLKENIDCNVISLCNIQCDFNGIYDKKPNIKALGFDSEIGLERLSSPIFWLSYIFRKTSVRFFDKLVLLYLNILSAFVSRKDIDFFDADYSNIIDTAPLKKAILENDPDIVHADNTRSILRYKEYNMNKASVALVRDLRFICPRKTDMAYIDNRTCSRCDFSCLDNEPLLIRGALKRVLKLNKDYRQSILRKYDKVLTTSSFLKEMLEKELDLDIGVIPNPIKASKSLEVPEEGNSISILYAGMFNKNKGPDLLAEAFSQLTMTFDNITLTFAGRGQFAFTLKKICLNCMDKVGFTGFLSNEGMQRAYKEADIVVCPTRWPEPFGRVVLEAMSHGCLVLASDSGNFKETIKNDYNGFLFKPFDVECLKERLRFLIENHDKLDYIRENAFKLVKEYNINKISGRYLKFYESLI